MHKPKRRSTLHHLRREKKLSAWRHLARQLIKGDITIPQMERIAGPASKNVLRSAAYLMTKEPLSPPALVAQAIGAAVAPALASSNLPKPALPTPRVAVPVAAAPAPAAAVAEPAAPARPRTRAAAPARPASAKDAAPAAEAAKPARRTATRAPKAAEASAEEKPAAKRPARKRTTDGESS